MNQKISLSFVIPHKYQEKVRKVRSLLVETSIFPLLCKLAGRKWDKELVIKHKNLDKQAQWQEPNYILVDFVNKPVYICISISHEFAHLLLHNPPWWKAPAIAKVIKQYEDFKTPRFGYDFRYALEQTLAILLQSAAEKELGTRQLLWEQWQPTFKGMDVLEFGKKFWPQWLKYVGSSSKYKIFDEWLHFILQKDLS